MTTTKPLFAGVGVPALIGTLVVAAILSGVLGAMAFSAIMLALDWPTTGENLSELVMVMLASGAFIGLFAVPFILLPLIVAGVPMAVAFNRHGLSYRWRYLLSGLASVALGALMGAGMWQGDPYGFAIGGGFALLSAWLWLSLLFWVESRRLRQLSSSPSITIATAKV